MKLVQHADCAPPLAVARIRFFKSIFLLLKLLILKGDSETEIGQSIVKKLAVR
jgi:hypothetical protein